MTIKFLVAAIAVLIMSSAAQADAALDRCKTARGNAEKIKCLIAYIEKNSPVTNGLVVLEHSEGGCVYRPRQSEFSSAPDDRLALAACSVGPQWQKFKIRSAQ